MTIYDKTIDEKILFPVGIGILQTETVRNFYNTSDATATPDDILVGKTAYSRYGIINGELDLQNEKETSYQEGYEFGYDEGNDAGYVLGKDDGKELGREEIIDEQSDANITPNDVLEGKIGYGPNNERIVGTNVGGFDYSVIGYSPAENQALNTSMANNINYAKTLYNEWDPSGTSANYLYSENRNLVIAPLIDTSNVTSMRYMFENCTHLTTVPLLNTSKVTNMGSMFWNCASLLNVPQFDVSNVTNMNSMFTNCRSLINVDFINTSKVTSMNQMFSGCESLTSIPQFDVSNVTEMSQMCQATNLSTIPSLNTIKNTTFYGFTTSQKLTSIGKLRGDAVTNMQYFLYFVTANQLTDFGGIENLGMKSSVSGLSDSYFLNAMPNLTKQSLLNVLNGLYDRASAGMSTLTLKLHNNHKNILSAEDIAIATNKGWIIS